MVVGVNIAVGGLVGETNGGEISTSYSTAYAPGTQRIGSLTGIASSSSAATNRYWDTSTSAGEGKMPRELQTETEYSGIYADWNANLDGEAGTDDPWEFGNGMQYPMLKYKGMSLIPQGSQAMGIADNWNAPVAGERLGVCLVDGPSMRGIVSGQTYLEGWVWERSSDGATWTVISGAGDNAPTYEYSPVVADLNNFIRARVKLNDGTTAYTRALGGRVVAASAATAGAPIPFVRGGASPQVGTAIVAANAFLQSGVSDVRSGWQRCPNNTAPHSDCVSIPLRWQFVYTPVAADVGSYLRFYAYYQAADGTWTRRVTPFTTAVVAAQ